MARKTRRPFGEILLDLEKLIDELFDDHDVQWGDVFYWLLGHVMIHRKDAREEYTDGTHPEFYYGPKRR